MKTKLSVILLFLIPGFTIVGILYYMLFWTALVSTMNWVGMAPVWKFIGLKNYEILFHMPRFWTNVKNNLIWLLVFVLPTGTLGMVLAYVLEQFPKLSRYFKPIFLYPLVIAPVVAGTIWAWIFEPQTGVLNNVLSLLGLETFKGGWIADPRQAIYCMIMAGIWQNFGFSLVLYTAAIKEIPSDHIDAARVDGAKPSQIFFYVVVPEISHATIIVFSLLVLYTLKIFDLVWVMTGGGPGYSTEVLPYFMYRVTFRQLMVGMGAAIAMIILLISFLVLVPMSKWMMERWER